MYQEETTSTFTHHSQKYNLNKLLSITASRPIQTIPTKDLVWILDFTTVDPQRIEKADINSPLLVIKEDQYIVLDGAHRLAKAVQQNIPELSYRKVTTKDLEQCKI